MFTPDNIVGREPGNAITGDKMLNIARRWQRSVWLDRTEAVIGPSRKFHGVVSQGTIFMGIIGRRALDQSFTSSASTSACRRRGVETTFSGLRQESGSTTSIGMPMLLNDT